MPTWQRSGMGLRTWTGSLQWNGLLLWDMAGGCQERASWSSKAQAKSVTNSPILQFHSSLLCQDRTDSTFECTVPRWLAEFKEAGDGKTNVDMSKIRPLRRLIWPLGQLKGYEIGKSFCHIHTVCAPACDSDFVANFRLQTEHNIQKMKSKESGFSRTKCIKSNGKHRHDGSSRSSPIEPINPGQVTFLRLNTS